MWDWLVLAITNVALYAANPRTVLAHCRQHRRLPNVAHPQCYLDLMMWRKMVDHNPLFVVFSDKLASKDYARRVCPDLAVPRTLWIGDDADAIPDDVLTGDVYVKTNHGWKSNYRINEGQFDRADLKRKTDGWLAYVHGRSDGQWAYTQIEPKLFVEEAIGDPDGDLLEFNVRAGNGEVVLGSVVGHSKKANEWTVFLDLQGNATAGTSDADGAPIAVLPPGLDIAEPFQRALSYTKKLSTGVDYARFDFMWNGATLYMGEITVYPAAGVGTIGNTEVHAAIVRGWDLNASGFLQTQHTGLKGWYASALKRRLVES